MNEAKEDDRPGMRGLKPFAVICLCLTFLAFAGCSSGERIYELSGAVTFNGKPVPAGAIIFEPDTSAGNNGGSGFAKIKDGHYDTRILDGRGVVGGPHLVRIMGLDGVPRSELPNGISLFQDYNITVDLPKANGTKDFDVPRK
jgi:hypothetical protein